MTSYADFQAHYLRHIWREGDAALTAELPILIAEAERRISRDLRALGFTTQTTLAVTSNEVTLPVDYAEARVVRINDMLAKPADASRVRQFINSGANYVEPWDSEPYTVYAATATKLIFPGMFSVSNPADLFLDYYVRVAPYATHVSGDSFYDQNPDFYKAALGITVGDFLMDDVLEAKSEAKYQKLLEDMEEESIRQEFAGAPINVILPGVVR